MPDPEDGTPTPPSRPVPPRPAPPRPDVAVTPLRPRTDRPGTPPAQRAALGLWIAVAVVVVGVAAVVAFEYSGVRAALETSVAQQDSTATAAEISDTVTVTLLSSGAAAAVLLLLGGLGLSLMYSRRPIGKIVTAGAGLLTAAASGTFWSFMSDAGSIAAGVLQWGPLAAAVLAAAAAVAALASRPS